jgi:endonuclease V-like protein UPF0215 family
MQLAILDSSVSAEKLSSMKKEIRLIGIDDAPFNKIKKGSVLVIATFFRGGSLLEGILSTKVKVDGNDSTKKLIMMINNSKFKPQIQAILLNGIALGGFNIINIQKLNKKTKIPVIVVIRDYPDFKKIKSALIKIKKEKKYKLIENAGSVIKIGKIFVQLAGIKLQDAKEILKISCTRSFIPEPIRISHIIASGIIDGESRGKA